jgi:hypothetical protein
MHSQVPKISTPFQEDRPDMYSIGKEGGAWVVRFACDPLAAEAKENQEQYEVMSPRQQARDSLTVSCTHGIRLFP